MTPERKFTLRLFVVIAGLLVLLSAFAGNPMFAAVPKQVSHHFLPFIGNGFYPQSTPTAQVTPSPTPTLSPTEEAKELIHYGVALKSISSFAGFFSQNEAGEKVFFGTTRSGEYLRLFRYNVDQDRVDLVVPIVSVKGSWTLVQDGNVIYIGTYYNAALFKYDLESGILTRLATLEGEKFVWEMKLRDGRLYLGTSPSAKVFIYHLDTGNLESLGRLSTEKYVRTLEVVGNTLYAGIGAQADLIEYDLLTGEFQSILPAEFSNENNFVYHIQRIEDKLILGLTSTNQQVMFDTQTRAFSLLMENAVTDPGITTPTFGPDFVHFRGLFDFLFEFDQGTNTLSRLLPVKSLLSLAGGEIIDQTNLAGLTNDAIYIEIGFDGGIDRTSYLTEKGLDAIQTNPTSITANDGQVFLAERQLRIFNTEDRTDAYRMVAGEPKVMCANNLGLFTADYTGATLWKYPPIVLRNPLQYNFASDEYMVLDIEQFQNRPKAIYCGADYVLVGTEPDYGLYGGALTYYDNHGAYTARNVVPNHTILSIAVEEKTGARFAYLGTSISGGSGSINLAEDAHLVKYDLDRRVVLYDVIPQESNGHILNLAFGDGVVYALLSNGSFLSIDADTGAVLTSRASTNMKGFILSKDGNLYGITSTAFIQIDKTTLAPKTLGNLPNLSLITEDPTSGAIYLVSGFDLWGYQ